MGAKFKRFLDLEPAAMEALASWSELDPRQVQALLSWTGVVAGNVRMEFRGEVCVPRPAQYLDKGVPGLPPRGRGRA
jgi:hypothetical protein